MKWMKIPLGPLQTNCYIVYNDQKECVIFDPGEEAAKLMAKIDGQRLKPLAILLTHAHFDHIGAVDKIRNQYKVPVYIHKQEETWLSDGMKNGSQNFLQYSITAAAAEHVISEETQLTFNDFVIHVMETPGHSPGSVSFYLEKEEIVVSGDALFQGSIGRTDLYKGSMDQLLKSIHTKLLSLPERTIVLPGHGPTTTIEEEMVSNPYLNGF
ncbi:hypothetical protein Q73_09305 [Bacillus coahuilensis m2-6]|uniref:Metallo-beta-lactamase domain-containing protein n=1 Tax=Bacillus coahuilensis p1.1.43 TaxID=1150625 RepID=A0A147K7B8_9BACI|nr:MBL fold metallo-hydrolase [Bacillus coahuilensis]KUP05969.1 hypothetical protein Q75_09890 [Bacillus coahuilensis p1.1.43]KUP07401.1 hypothetical protein Q73_09305 [Bacillus coahuilensis m2-6]